jgi:hypothetical protein|tara:strand:- start:39 stop:239 length:201 start_codon:yes stop_codon:yes gene_type:complete
MTTELYVVLWLIFLAGTWYSFRENGKMQYAQGISDAIEMHHTGELVYKITHNKDGEDDIEIKIKGG